MNRGGAPRGAEVREDSGLLTIVLDFQAEP